MRAHRWLVPALALLAVAGLAVAPVGSAGAGTGGSAAAATQESPCTGTVTDPADGVTVVSVQGAQWEGVDGSTKRPARLVAFGPNGSVRWVKDYGEIVWGYDVDPTDDGLFVTGTVREGGEGKTRVFELDPETGERDWEVTLDSLDTHDADLVDDGDVIAVANMRNYDEESGVNRDRLYFYDRESGEVVDEWLFDDHYPPELGDQYAGEGDDVDWTHVNDVEHLGGDRYMLSPRNFDMVVVVDVGTDEVVYELGSYGDKSVLNRQHNPDYLESEDGAPTVIVGDSDNDRIVEYEHVGGSGANAEWERTWSLGEGQFDWPRDADRLPNGNTLVTDSRNHRVLEVTPEGEVVWEVYVPWTPYDAERIGTGDESSGPTIADMDAKGAVTLDGSAGRHEDLAALEACDDHLSTFPYASAETWPPEGNGSDLGERTPPGSPLATPGPLAAGAALGLVVVVVLAVRYRYRRGD